MSHSTILYCAADFESANGGFLNLALISPENQWFYAEVIDYAPEGLDQKARSEIAPRLMKVPRARFVRHDDLATELAEFFTDLGQPALDIRTVGDPDARIQKLVRIAASEASLLAPPQFRQAKVDHDRLASFHRHCGGIQRTAGHPLVLTTGTAICDLERNVPTKFSDASVHHFELLMGSKNAGSYRAWARAQEREWLEAHGEPASAPTTA